MNYNFSKTHNVIFVFVGLYISLLIGFFFNENLNLGAKPDWYSGDLIVINDLSLSLKKTLLNYEIYGHRHSPVYLVFLSFLKKIGFSFDIIRFIHLNLSILLIYFFYKCLSLKFDNVEKNLLLIFSFSIFLSPTFRSLAIWPSSRVIGLLFFTISILEFLKYQKFDKKEYIWKNTIFLILASYISPNFSLFIFYFSYHYLKKNNLVDLIPIYIFGLFCSFPVFYYLIILDINFLMVNTPGTITGENISLSFNFSDKILIISSIILFHFSPFIINKDFLYDILKSLQKNIFFIGALFVLLVYFFNYQINYTGGGIFFQISNLFFKNNIFFYFISFISLTFIFYLSKNSLCNLIIFCTLIISNIQNTIYHKYYDPLLMILFFSLINFPKKINFFERKYNILIIYLFYALFIFSRIFKNILSTT